MTHPHFTSVLLPPGARSFTFRSHPARFVDNRNTSPSTLHFEPGVAAYAWLLARYL